MEYIKIVIYAYFFIMILFILFNIGINLKEKISIILIERKKEKYKNEILKEIKQFKKKKQVSKNHKSFLEKELIQTKNLLIFEEVLMNLKKDKEELMNEYCINISNIFQVLADTYRKKDSIQKAYFSHVLSEFPELLQSNDNSIAYAMMYFVFDQSVYCRENAMLFFYHKGSAQQVVNSLKKISKRNLYYSPKLLADDLLQFTGDSKELISLLLSEFNEFCVNFQVAIVNYIRFMKEDKKEELYQKLISKKYHKEVDLAIIRYFARYQYTPVLEVLLNMMQDKNSYSYEYRIVSAMALAIYDKKEVRKILIESLSDTNWYVRKNASISLTRMDITPKELNDAFKTEDKYAKEMLEYVFKEKGWLEENSKEGLGEICNN